MTQVGPSSAFVIIAGKNVSSQLFSLDDVTEQKLAQTNGLGDSMLAYKPIGLANVALETGGGYYDDATTGLLASIQGLGQTRLLWSYGLSGNAMGADTVMMDGLFAMAMKRIASRDDLTRLNAVYRCSGTKYKGSVIHSLTAETTASSNNQATSFDRNVGVDIPLIPITSSSVANPTVITTPIPHGLVTGDVVMIANHSGSTPAVSGAYAATVTSTTTFTVPVNVSTGGTGGTVKRLTMTGGYVDLHVPDLTLGGYTSVTIKARHSADNITFSDLATFTDVTAAYANERVTIAGTINRYLAISWLFNGAGSGMSITPYVTITNT